MPPAQAVEESSVPPLGQPDEIGLVAPAPAAAERQIENATGLRFQYLTSETASVDIDGAPRPQQVRLSSAATGGRPGIEVLQASPAIGPWRTSPGRTRTFLSYPVNNLDKSAAPLRRAGWRRVAAARTFSYWEGSGGVLVRLTLQDGGPTWTGGETSSSPAALALYPCKVDGLKNQLTGGLGVTWLAPQTYTLPWALADGSVRMHTSTSVATTDGAPFLALEPPHGFPGEDGCSAATTPVYLVFTATDVSAAESRLTGAGMSLIARVPTMIAAYRGVNGLSLELTSPSFLPTE
jgi:hypothetical protein